MRRDASTCVACGGWVHELNRWGHARAEFFWTRAPSPRTPRRHVLLQLSCPRRQWMELGARSVKHPQ
eukprot:1159674-Pelagomonas_calceolata.AAC.4